MKTSKIAVGVVSIIALGMIVYFVNKNRLEKRLTTVADAGYETAYDVLYPLRSQRVKKR